MNHYETLGVAPNASPEEIKQAFRRAASAAHPDRGGGSNERMQAVNRAHEVLSDPARRERYDRTGQEERVDIERMAHDLLVQTFERALQGEMDLVRAAVQHLEQLAQNITRSKGAIEAQREKLVRRSGKVKVKTGENLAQQIIDRKLRDLDRQLAQATEALEVHARASEMLANYEGEPEPPRPRAYDPLTDAMVSVFMQAQQNGQFNRGGWGPGL